ncbi:hypothetical protein OHA25_08235 [Nonomuraea sp. NBC_00507]|uniref:hypothetical protein n=1 Tax=Nonomuraea sp. NBC_00507 TaxID=2976002 RepID=UPI002E190E61
MPPTTDPLTKTRRPPDDLEAYVALPPSYNLCTLRGNFVDLLGNPATGQITFTAPTTTVSIGDGITVLPSPLIVMLVNGKFQVQLPATDDANMTPHGWTCPGR